MQPIAQQAQASPFFTFLAGAAGVVVVLLAGGLSVIIIVKAANGTINLSRLISEPNGDASISRLQLLIFTFIIALSLFLIVMGKTPPAFPESIPADLMTLLGISASSYLVSKGIQFTNPAGVARPGITVTPAAQTVTGGAVLTFTANVSGGAGATLPDLNWSLDAPSHGTLNVTGNTVTYTPDPNATPGTKVTLRAKGSGFEDGTAQITY